jgi:hypothetical protein
MADVELRAKRKRFKLTPIAGELLLLLNNIS